MQVWCNNRLVGEAKIAMPPDRSGYEAHVMQDFDFPTVLSVEPLDEEVAVSKIYMPIEKRHVMIDDMEFMQGVGDVEMIVRRHHNIPAEATVSRDVARMRRVFSWKVFSIDAETFETIFDMDWFEPSDTGEVDNEALERAWRARL